MLQKKSLKEAIADWNYLCQSAEDVEDPEALEEIMNIIKATILEECGIEEPNIRFINSRAQIEEIPHLLVVKDET